MCDEILYHYIDGDLEHCYNIFVEYVAHVQKFIYSKMSSKKYQRWEH